MNIEDIQDNFRIGSEVSVILRTGHQFSGTLSEIREASIILRQSSGGKIPLSAEAIDCIFPVQDTELPGGTAPVVQNSSVMPLPTSFPQQAPPSQTVPPPPAPTPPLVPASIASEATPTYPIEVITQVVEIAARFKTAIQQANLEPLSPDFSLPDSISSMLYSQKKNKMQGEWNRLENQYRNALKVKELSRLNQIIRGYEQVLKNYPEVSSVARFNMGCLYLKLGQASEALKTFELAASYSREPRIFYNLAAVALRKKDKAKACYALQEFFKFTSISQHLTAWYKFLGLALDSGVVNVLSDLLKQALIKHRSDDAELIVESAIFLLKENDHTDDAHRLMAFLQQRNLEPDGTPELLESMLSQLELEPTEEYNRQQQELRNAQEQAKRQEEYVKRQKKVESFLSNAGELARRGQYNQAIAEVRKALQIDPENTIAKQLEAEYREADKERGLPTGSGSYAQAKRAQIIEQDFRKAEKLYREAIKKGDNAENAVKDIAGLLQQQNKDDEAIQILIEYRNKVSNKQTILNMLANAYQRVGKYQDEIAVLQQVLSLTAYDKRSTVLKRIALAQFRLGDYKKSKQTLEQAVRQNPRDENVLNLLEALRDGEKTGVYTKLDALFLAQEGTADAQTTLSEFLAFHVDQCDYAGVEAPKIASKQFTEKDVEKLQRSAEKGLGTERPRERASYYLSAAKILMDLGSKAEELRPRVYLRNFCAAMGDACIAEQKNKDVARSYYAEAFLIAPDWVPQLEVKLSQYIMLYYSNTEDLLKTKLPTVESCLEQALKIPNLGTPVIEGLLYLSWLNREVGRIIINKINPNKRLRELVQGFCYQTLGEKSESLLDEAAFLELWERGRELMRRRNQEVVDEFAFLNSVATGLNSIQEQIDKVQALGQKVRGNLDKQRLNTIKEILNSIYDYSQQQSYMEREYFATIIQSRVLEVVDDIEKNPTKSSWELFRPYLLCLGDTIKKHFDEVQLAAEPEQLPTELSIDSYMPDLESRVECQITISNETGKSPASAIAIQVKESPNNEYLPQRKSIDVTEALPGGQSVTCLIPVVVTESARESQVFTLYYQLSFTTRRGNKIQIDNTQSIKLYPETDFKEINNPYATYAQGSTVEDRNMFYGRDQLINTLLSSIRHASSAKSLVIYGQKRAGKSSVLYHLKQQLELPIIPATFSMGAIINDLSISTFLYQITECVNEAFEELAERGYPSILVQRPTIDKFQQNPQLWFQEYMASLRRSLKQVEEYREAKIMLLIDEFSYIYGEIRRGRVQDTFMKSWKALLEKRYFGAILVGQDTMPQFITRFPNEFQVAESQRVSYLAEDDACRLIVDPIRIPGTKESRYKGDAVNRLLNLTAGSPYYIQIFCNRLVEYMNCKKAIYVTDADIERVKENLISGHNSLEDAVFDNLISAGDTNIDDISKEDALAVLYDIANGSRIQQYCDRSAITAHTSVPIDKILDDLVRREVVEKQRTSLFRIRVGLFKEWLLAHQ